MGATSGAMVTTPIGSRRRSRCPGVTWGRSCWGRRGCRGCGRRGSAWAAASPGWNWGVSGNSEGEKSHKGYFRGWILRQKMVDLGVKVLVHTLDGVV